MKKINDPKKVKELVYREGIDKYFSGPDLPFELYIFDRGEYLNNELDPFLYFSFMISGRIRILNIREDGSLFQIAEGSGFSVLGDLEFGSGTASQYLIEVLRKTYCISLPLNLCRSKLENDPVFLMAIFRSLALKLDALTASVAVPKTLEERLLHYMENECDNQILTGIEKAASRLSCSKRQLLRILKKLCGEEVIVKTRKGRYELIRK